MSSENSPLTIAHYRVVAKLGEGGMGTVYRATDTKLGRDVAIKVIPAEFARDPDRMARFAREAQVLASLNHPNIAAIYGVEENAIVMELVEGETLRGPLPPDQALAIVHQLIDALEYAHEKGVVHRDLKPANIKITPDARVKVLDFGLAKAMANEAVATDPVSSPTLTMRATTAGMIMGTAAYMAPEQARGYNVDKRADIWAFGVVLYEVLTGRQLFAGETVSDTLAAVLTKEPDHSGIPPRFVRLLRLCLVRDPKRRLREIGDARFLMDEPAASPVAAAPVVRSGGYRWIAAACALSAVVLAFLLWQESRPTPKPFLQLDADLGEGAVAGVRGSVAISPDASRIAYPALLNGGVQGLAVRELNQSKGTPLLNTERATLPFFSPDGQWVGFFADAKLKKISISGGAAITVCDALNGRGAHWGDDGSIVAAFANTTGISRIPSAGGTPKLITNPQEHDEVSHRWPQMLPGSQSMLFSVNTTATDWDQANVEVLSLKTGLRKTLQRGGYFGRYLPSGHLVYLYQGTLYGVGFDPVRLEIKGRPTPLVTDVAASTNSGGGQFDVSQNGTLVYLRGKAAESRFRFGWMRAGGKVEPLNVPLAVYNGGHLSPDDKQFAAGVVNTREHWLCDLERGTSSPISRTGLAIGNAIWAPDGRHIIYASSSGDINTMWWNRVDGAGEPVPLLQDRKQIRPASLSPDGRSLAFFADFLSGGVRILPLDISDPDRPKPGTPQTLSETGGEPVFSPDGLWIAYDLFESGSVETYVRRAPGSPGASTARWRVSTVSGHYPVWSRAGRQLFYVTTDGYVMSADYTVNGDAFVPGKPRRWSDSPIGAAAGSYSFDVSLDGKRIIACTPSEQEALKGNLHLTFLFNFFDEVRRRIP